MSNDLVCEALLEHGADPDHRDDFGAKPEQYLTLFGAISSGRVDQVEVLLQQLTGVAMTFNCKQTFGEEEFRVLCRALKRNRTVVSVVLDCSVDASRCQEDLTALFAENRTLRDLHIGYRDMNKLPPLIEPYLAANRARAGMGGLAA